MIPNIDRKILWIIDILQILPSPQVKQTMLFSRKYGIEELPEIFWNVRN